MYEDNVSRVKAGNKVCEDIIRPNVGVKQGCPMSPLLFSLVIEDMGSVLNGADIEDNLYHGNAIYNHQLFADDTTILSSNCEDVQKLLEKMLEFCSDTGLRINVDKTEAVQFHYSGNDLEVQGLKYNNADVVSANEFVYLGVMINSKQPSWRTSAEYAAARANKAVWAAWNRIQGLDIGCIKLQLTIIKALVMPVACYGCQIWGVDLLKFDSENHILNTPPQMVMCFVLRLISGCFSKVPRWNLIKEFGLRPVQAHILKCVVNVWNKGLDSTRVINKTLKADISLFCAGSNTCWTARLLQCLIKLDAIPGHDIASLRTLGPEGISRYRFNIKQLTSKLDDKYKTFEPDMHNCPRSCISRGAARVKYSAWFHCDSNKLIKSFIPICMAQTLLRFKLGSTYLNCYSHEIPRHDRICTFCSMNIIEDELHLVFECPKYRHVREDSRWTFLFDTSILSEQNPNLRMNKFFNQDNQYQIANFIFALVRQRNHYSRFGVPREVVVDMLDSTDSD
jgi:hypothetical protein